MLSKLEIKLEPPKEARLGIFAGSTFQGFLMESISTEYAEKLHSMPFNPYAQHIEAAKDGSATWVVTTTTEGAKENIIDRLLKPNVAKVHLKQKNLELPIVGKTLTVKSYRELLDKTYFGDCGKKLSLEFVSPTAFKVAGKYQFYPTVRHIFQSLAMKHDALEAHTEIYSEEVIEDIEKHAEIAGYTLRSMSFPLEGVKVPAFMGNVDIYVHANKQFVNLLHFLASVGEYTGVGIKASMGMGAMKIREERRNAKYE